MTLTDPATGAQRHVKMRSVKDLRITKSEDGVPDAGALQLVHHWPRLASILYGSHDPLASMPTPARLSLMEQMGWLEAE